MQFAKTPEEALSLSVDWAETVIARFHARRVVPTADDCLSMQAAAELAWYYAKQAEALTVTEKETPCP